MFIGDELHEWPLGTWKATFVHLIRILHAVDIALVHELDSRFVFVSRTPTFYAPNSHSRYRKMPTFGRDTIRRFSANTSEMKRLAARDFEGLLQVHYCDLSYYPETNLSISVLFRCSRICCPQRKMRLLWTFYLLWLTGEPL